MSVSAFGDLPLADRDRDGTATPPRNASAEGPTPRTNPTRNTATPTSGTTRTARTISVPTNCSSPMSSAANFRQCRAP